MHFQYILYERNSSMVVGPIAIIYDVMIGQDM